MSSSELIERIQKVDRDEAIEAARFFTRGLTKSEGKQALADDRVESLKEAPFSHVEAIEALARAVLIAGAQDPKSANDVAISLDGAARKQFVLGGSEIVALAALSVVALKIIVDRNKIKKTTKVEYVGGKMTVSYEETPVTTSIGGVLGQILRAYFGTPVDDPAE